MNIYTVVRTEETWSMPASTDLERSFRSLKAANKYAVGAVLRNIERRNVMAYAMFHDANHEDIRDLIAKDISLDEAKAYFEREPEIMRMPKSLRRIVEDYVRNEIESTACYYMCVEDGDMEEFHFEVIKNKLEDK